MDSFTSVMAFARKGLGLAVLPQRLADITVREGHLKVAPLKIFSDPNMADVIKYSFFGTGGLFAVRYVFHVVNLVRLMSYRPSWQ